MIYDSVTETKVNTAIFMLLVCQQLRREGRVTAVSDVVQRHQPVKVKVLTFNGQKTSLSMKVTSTFVLPVIYFSVYFTIIL